MNTTNTPVRMGIAGAGWWATDVMAPIIRECPDVVLQAVGARDAARGAALEPVGQVHTSYEALMADPEVDAVYIALSNDLHAPITELALRSGKHVLCEKPLALDTAEVQQMFATADAHDRLLLEGFWNQWHPRQRALVSHVASGALGDLESVDSAFMFGDHDMTGNYRIENPRGGGAAYDVACYPLSFAVSVLGGEPVAAEIEQAELNDKGIDLLVRARLTWSTGVTVTVGGSFIGPHLLSGSVRGTLGSAELSEPAFSGAPEPAEGTRMTFRGADGGFHGEAIYPACHPRMLMVSDFADVVAGRLPAESLPVTREHSLAVMRGLDLIHEELLRIGGTQVRT